MRNRKSFCNVCKRSGHIIEIEIYKSGNDLGFVCYPPTYLLEKSSGKRHQHRIY
jgi:hypothetical protein